MPFLLQALLVLAVLGFCFYLFRKHVARMIGSPFLEIMYFIVVVAAMASYRGTQDPTVAFTESRCTEADGVRVEKGELHRAYTAWRIANDAPVLTFREFNERLEARGIPDDRSTGGRYVWKGLALREEE